MKDLTARKALIVKMMRGFPSSASNISDETLASYVEATREVSTEALARSAEQFLSGRVEGHNNAFMPSAAELASNARQWDEAIAYVSTKRALREAVRITSYPIGKLPEPPAEPLGPIKIDLGHGEIDLSDKTPAEKEAIIRGEIPDQGKIAGFKMPQIKRVNDD